MNKKKIILSIVVLLFLAASSEVFIHRILLFPKSQFDHHLNYNEFNLYSDLPIPDYMEGVLNNVHDRLYNTLNYNNGHYQIFFCQQESTFKKFADKIGIQHKVQGMNLEPLNYIFINNNYISEIANRNKRQFKYHILEGNLAHIIAHEIVHQLISDELGFLKSRKTPNWKKEGYCEYAAAIRIKQKDPNYKLESLIKDYQNGTFNLIHSGQLLYIQSLLVTEFLIDKRGYDFADLMNEGRRLEELLESITSEQF